MVRGGPRYLDFPPRDSKSIFLWQLLVEGIGQPRRAIGQIPRGVKRNELPSNFSTTTRSAASKNNSGTTGWSYRGIFGYTFIDSGVFLMYLFLEITDCELSIHAQQSSQAPQTVRRDDAFQQMRAQHRQRRVVGGNVFEARRSSDGDPTDTDTAFWSVFRYDILHGVNAVVSAVGVSARPISRRQDSRRW